VRIFPYLEIIRPLNVLIAILVVIVAVFLSGTFDYRKEIPFILLTVIFLTAGANSLNDYFDREIDKLVHPSRPIVRGKLPPSGALIFGSINLLLAPIFSIYLKREALFIALLLTLLIFFYNVWLKKLPFLGNIVVSFVAGSIFLYVGFGLNRWKPLIFPALFAFLFHLGREIIKDIEDVEGDRVYGLKTLPVVFGEKKSRRLIQGIFLLLIALTPIPYFSHLYNLQYLLTVIFGVDLPLFVIVLHLNRKSVNMGKISTFLKIDIFIALFALYLGGKP
jgi:geranylgeranylglycerol-phosphate geranylgeranyltransferase